MARPKKKTNESPVLDYITAARNAHDAQEELQRASEKLREMAKQKLLSAADLATYELLQQAYVSGDGRGRKKPHENEPTSEQKSGAETAPTASPANP